MFTERIKSLRASRHLTQSQMADKIDVARTTYAMYEQGKRQPDFDVLKRLAEFYNVSTDYLLGHTDQRNPSEDYEIQTIAAHHDGDEWTEEELDEIARFKEFVRMKRGNKQQE